MCPKNILWMEELAGRIREVRVSAFGERGRAKFARALGVSPSTYNYYERARIPPIPTLLKISELTGVDLYWLLTGTPQPDQPGGLGATKHARLLARIGDLLHRRGEAGAAINAFVDLLESQAEVAGPPTPREALHSAVPRGASAPTRIPVLGRTAAGVPHFWKKRPPGVVEILRSAVAHGSDATGAHAATLTDPDDTTPPEVDRHVQLVQLARPVRIGELSVTEFLDCPGLVGDRPDAFALRVDGDSMHPSLSHGDLVIMSPRESAKPGRPAVVQLRNQIGVTCKLFYTDKTHVHLIPINEQLQPTRHPLEDLVWALAVLYRVRLSGSSSGAGQSKVSG